MWAENSSPSLPESCCVSMCWNVADPPHYPTPSALPPYLSTPPPSSSQSASHTAPSLRHLHISSSLGQSIKLNPCLGWLTNGWWAHIVMELFFLIVIKVFSCVLSVRSVLKRARHPAKQHWSRGVLVSSRSETERSASVKFEQVCLIPQTMFCLLKFSFSFFSLYLSHI